MRALMWLAGTLIMWAPSDNFQLSWEAPEGCPPPTALREETRRILGRDPGDGVDLVQAVMRVEESAGTFSLEIEISTPDGQTHRTLEAERCETLMDAAALVVAVAVDPMAALMAPPRAPAPAPAREEVAKTDPQDAPLAPASEAATATSPGSSSGHRTMTTYLGVAAGIEGSVLPGVGPGLQLALGARPTSALRVGIFGTAWSPRDAPFEQGRASMWMWTAGLRICAHPTLGPIEVPVCIAAEAGQLRAQGRGLPTTAAARQPWAALLLGPGLQWAFHRRVRLVGGADVVTALVRPGFAVDGIGEVFRAPKVAFRGLVGLEFALSGTSWGP